MKLIKQNKIIFKIIIYLNQGKKINNHLTF